MLNRCTKAETKEILIYYIKSKRKMKLELKHLAPYIPYGLKVEILDFPLNNVFLKHYRTLELDCGHDFHFYFSENRVIPVLRPMPDLIEDSETFNLLNLELEPNGLFLNGWFLLQNFNDVAISYEDMQKILNFLYAKHYDVFGLIPLGLAISIHDVAQAEA